MTAGEAPAGAGRDADRTAPAGLHGEDFRAAGCRREEMTRMATWADGPAVPAAPGLGRPPGWRELARRALARITWR